MCTKLRREVAPQLRSCSQCHFMKVYAVEPSCMHHPGQSSHVQAERYLPGVFLKYNSNAGYVNREAPDSEIAQPFSHYTFQDRSFGPGDLGFHGMWAFFRSHRCGTTRLCAKMQRQHGHQKACPVPQQLHHRALTL